ncbi:uncharacterized protein LOC129613877 [Condylostylus longicornis]|uniref:uncharacterized protein LOC129613877 n=1 Tax=Condylostylus longicornis TaxID=2530218 RepID=UPI00244DE2E5|nr:uncharacterized protein LOC129613877 [Condylostylus longicornis]
MVKTKYPRIVPDLIIVDKTFEAVKEFKYLGVNITQDGDTTAAITDRIPAAGRAFYAHNKLLKSKLITKATKMKIYLTLIRPVLTYGCETWTLKANENQNLLIFERKVLRKIYGPIRNEDGSYRIRYNHELEELIGGKNVVRYVKAQRIRWLGHILRMPEERAVYKIYARNPVGTRRRGRPRKRWKEAVEEDLRVLRVNNYTLVAQNREEWRGIVEQAQVHHGLL